jgi:putative nucleotidyltransferase with HDIG domain
MPLLETSPRPSSVSVQSRTVQRILLVDDELEVLASLTHLLAQAGYQVTAASSLAAALQALDRERFHLVLTDLFLGEDDLGYQVAERAHGLSPRVPVVLLTGRPSFDRALEAMRTRVAEIVVKPADAHAILTTCRRIIAETEMQRRTQDLTAQNRILASVLPRAIEAKDPTTSGHAERVVQYADVLAQRCSVDPEDRESLRLAALLHDVGKIGIPNQILTKPGPLTADERDVVNRHPQTGYEILASLEHHENVRVWVYQHHERWDGKGYPNRLKGEEVALPGRILVLAEVYDALAEPRSYKSAWEMPAIVAWFRDQAGRQFDPELAHLVADGLERMGRRFFASRTDLLF